MVSVTIAVGLAIGAVGCGGGGDDDKKPDNSASATKQSGSEPSTQEGKTEAPIAEIRGADGLLMQIASVQRDSGGIRDCEWCSQE